MTADDPRILAGRYELIERLGSGGMASVWRAQDLSLRRQVAIKLVHEHIADDDAVVARFRLEAQHAAALSHPNIVSVYDWVIDPPRQFMVLELVEGQNLRERLNAVRRLSVSETLEIMTQVLSGLGQAHERGIVHRDIKPENVLLARPSTRAEVAKLSDFGIAKSLADQERLTKTGLIGTPAYIAPELLGGGTPSTASDVYAVGCVIYECLTGEPPFTGEPMAVALQHQHAKVPPLTAERSDVPKSLSSLVDRAMAKDPTRRFAAAGPMLAALRTVAASTSGPPPPQARGDQRTVTGDGSAVTSKPSRRRLVILAAAAGLVVLCAGVGAALALSGSTNGPSIPSPASVLGPHPAVSEVAYQNKNGDVCTYDTHSGQIHVIATASAASGVQYSSVSFRTRSQLSYAENSGGATPNVLYLANINTGQRRILFTSDTEIYDAEWSPDGSSLAYLVAGARDTVKLYDMRTGQSSTVVTLAPETQPNTNNAASEVATTWSPNGKMLAITDTYVVPPSQPTMWVVRPDGSQVVAARDGTFATWSNNSQDLYYRPYAGGTQWLVLSVTDGSEGLLDGIRADAVSPFLSPAGTDLTYSDQNSTQSVYSYDLSIHVETKVASGYTGPFWLTQSAVLAVKSSPCAQGSECIDPWQVAGPADIIDVSTGQRVPTSITSMDSSEDTDTWPH